MVNQINEMKPALRVLALTVLSVDDVSSRCSYSMFADSGRVDSGGGRQQRSAGRSRPPGLAAEPDDSPGSFGAPKEVGKRCPRGRLIQKAR